MESRLSRALVAGALVAVACGGQPPAVVAPPRFSVRGGFPTAPDGRALILRGLNYANDHKFPDPKTTSFFPPWESARDFSDMRSYGFNSVRLIITWEAVEPQPGAYDEHYLDALMQRLDWAAAAGVWVIVDMHQDIYAREFGGDGAPKWAVVTDGIPFQLSSTWYLNFASPAVQRAMDNFFNDKQALLTHFVDAWAHVAERVREHPALVGYDLLNEPFPGSKALNVDAADRDVMNPFYERLIARLAQVDRTHLFFVEPSAVRTNVFAGGFPSQMERYAAAAGRMVFSPHLYDPVVTTTGKYDGDKSRLETNVTKLAAEAKRLAAGLWVGEWSVWDGHVDNGDAFLRDQLDAMDEHLASWSFWNFSRNPGDKTSPTQTPSFLDQLARPQLSVVAGVPEIIACTAAKCTFRYTEQGAGESEFLIPATWSTSPVITVTPTRTVRKAKQGTLLDVFVASGGTQSIVVTVSR